MTGVHTCARPISSALIFAVSFAWSFLGCSTLRFFGSCTRGPYASWTAGMEASTSCYSEYAFWSASSFFFSRLPKEVIFRVHIERATAGLSMLE